MVKKDVGFESEDFMWSVHVLSMSVLVLCGYYLSHSTRRHIQDLKLVELVARPLIVARRRPLLDICKHSTRPCTCPDVICWICKDELEKLRQKSLRLSCTK